MLPRADASDMASRTFCGSSGIFVALHVPTVLTRNVSLSEGELRHIAPGNSSLLSVFVWQRNPAGMKGIQSLLLERTPPSTFAQQTTTVYLKNGRNKSICASAKRRKSPTYIQRTKSVLYSAYREIRLEPVKRKKAAKRATLHIE